MSNAKTDEQRHDEHQHHSQRRQAGCFSQTLDAIPKCNDNIATSEAIADTGATSIFIMEGADVKNKRPAI
jgi:hypothetical protein